MHPTLSAALSSPCCGPRTAEAIRGAIGNAQRCTNDVLRVIRSGDPRAARSAGTYAESAASFANCALDMAAEVLTSDELRRSTLATFAAR